MDFQSFCAFNGIELPKQFIMLDRCRFPNSAITIDFTILMVSSKGQAIINVDSEEKHIGRRYLSVFRTGQTIKSQYMSDDFQSKVLLIGGNLEKTLRLSNVYLTMFVLDDSPVIKVSRTYMDSANLFFEALSRVVRFQDNPYQEECLLSLMRAFFYSTGYFLYEAIGFSEKGRNLQNIAIRLKAFSEDSVIRRFIDLVEKNCRNHRSLSFYANLLDYHPKYLSTLVKRQTGHTGQSIIDQYAILMIKGKLSLGDKSIKEISNEMDFPSQSDFGKFFKRMTGQSPIQYRKQYQFGSTCPVR